MSIPCEQKDSIEKILDRVGSLEISKARTDTLIESFTETNKELSNTMKQVEKTMIKMQSSLENNEDKINELNDKVDTLNQNEEKNKIDMRDVIKPILIKGLVGLLSLYGIFELINKGVGE